VIHYYEKLRNFSSSEGKTQLPQPPCNILEQTFLLQIPTQWISLLNETTSEIFLHSVLGTLKFPSFHILELSSTFFFQTVSIKLITCSSELCSAHGNKTICFKVFSEESRTWQSYLQDQKKKKEREKRDKPTKQAFPTKSKTKRNLSSNTKEKQGPDFIMAATG